jgi:acyl carrier protein
MERTEIIDAVYDACVEVLKVDKATLSETTSFAEDLEADSLALVEVAMQLEEQFDLTIPEDELEGVGTIGAAADVVAKHLDAAA